MTHPSILADLVRQGLAARAQPSQAGAMQAYMKSALPVYGVSTPQRRQWVQQAVTERPLLDAAQLAPTVLALWRPAKQREERHAALDLLR